MTDSNSPAQPQEISINWKIAGRAGEGVMTTSETFARACHRHGLFIFNYYEYPSLIKGGHQTGQVYASNQHATCQKRKLDFLIALDENGIKLHQDEITAETIIIAEPNVDNFDIKQYKAWTPNIFNIELTTISREVTNTSIAANTVALGVSAFFLGLQKEIFYQLIQEQFSTKSEEVRQLNIKAFDAGFVAAQKVGKPIRQITPQQQTNIVLTGGEAIGTGAIAGGLQFYSAYPMSPSSNAFHFVAAQQDKYPLVVRHAEDEIAAVNLAVGASYSGVRSMTGTAGGGFALMVETLSLTGVMETPLVILVAQRPGPATGLPTWTGQGDLQFVIRAGHGEFQRVVMTPGNTQEHFEQTKQAMDLAEKYQIPVIILTDKYLIESHQTMPKPAEEFQLHRQSMVRNEELSTDDSFRRYKITENGISPRSVPGQPHGLQITNSYEHDEFGYAIEDAEMTIKQVEKRAKKLEELQKEIPQPYVIGPETADITFVCWGSTLSIIQQLIHELSTDSQQLTVNAIHIPCIWPFPKDKFTELATKAKKLVMIEGNHTGQAEQLIRQETGIVFEKRVRRFDGRPFYVEDIIDWLKNN